MNFIKLFFLLTLTISPIISMEQPSLTEFFIDSDGKIIPLIKEQESPSIPFSGFYVRPDGKIVDLPAPTEKPTRKNPLEEYILDKRKTTYDFSALKKQAQAEINAQKGMNSTMEPLDSDCKEPKQQLEPPILTMITEADIFDSKNPIKSKFMYNPNLATKSTRNNSARYDTEASAKAARELMQVFDMQLSETTTAYNKKYNREQLKKQPRATAHGQELLFDDSKQSIEKDLAVKKAIIEQQIAEQKKIMEIAAAKEKAMLEAKETSEKIIRENQLRSSKKSKLSNTQMSGEIEFIEETNPAKKSSKQRKFGEIKLVFEKPEKVKKSEPEKPKIISDSESA